MLYLGMKINGYTVTQISALHRNGSMDGAIILAIRASDDEHVVALIPQYLIDAPDAAPWWDNGAYFKSSLRDVNSLREFLERSGIAEKIGM